MAKDTPLVGVFRIAKLVGKSSSVKLRKHHYRLGWESKDLEYNQRFGVGRYRDTQISDNG